MNSDQPITSSAQDIIGRKYFAHPLAETILSYDGKDSLVLGLYGEWGSGKTSLLNLTCEEIDELTKNNKDKPIIVHFNPWNFSGQDQLITQYFSMLSGLLKKNKNESLINIGEMFETYSELFKPISLIPIVGLFALIFKIFGWSLKNWGRSSNKNSNELKQKLSDLLKALNYKIIVIIDDIDRLTPNEICQIFQLVKSIADFPNTIYLLSFDKKVVLHALSKVHNGSGNEYLEKIIQVPFEIPQLSKNDLYKFLFAKINNIIPDVPDNKINEIYLGNIFQSGIKYYFNSLRDVIRFINTLSFGFSLVKDSVNPIDFIAITAIQVFDPDLYYIIRANKNLFVGVHVNSAGRLYGDKDKERDYYASLINTSKKIPQKNREELLCELFPRLESIFGHTNFGEGWSGEWRKKCRICSEEHFDTYFKLVVDKSNLTPNEMEIILANANDPNKFRDILLELNKENRILKFLDYLEDYTNDKILILDENIQNIMSTLVDIGDLFSGDEDISNYEWNIHLWIKQIFYKLCNRFKDQDTRFSLIKEAFEKSSNSIYTIINIVIPLIQENKKFLTKKNKSLDELIINPEQLDVLQKLAIIKINEWKMKPEFINHRHLGSILGWWGDIENDNAVKDYVNNLINSDDGKINFARAFLGKTTVQSAGDYVSRINWKIDLAEMSKFINLKEVEPRLRELKNTNLEGLDEIHKIAIKTFIDAYDKKNKTNNIDDEDE